MTDSEKKVKELQVCLGEKKLKQLGLIPCSTCRKILTQVMNIDLPADLENKPFLTLDEMATISQIILESTNGSLKNAPINDSSSTFDASIPISNSSDNEIASSYKENIEAESINDTSHNVNTSNSISNKSNSTSSLLDNIEFTPELIKHLNDSPLKNEEELVSKLLSILSQSHHIVQDNLGIGYIYTPPVASPFAHSLSCCECGRLYAILTAPSLQLMPLPVYLSNTEYEMIKGVYVDIFL